MTCKSANNPRLKSFPAGLYVNRHDRFRVFLCITQEKQYEPCIQTTHTHTRRAWETRHALLRYRMKGCIAVTGDTANTVNGEETTLADCNITLRRGG